MQETRGWEWGDCRGSDTRRLALPIWGRAHMGFRPIWASVWFLGRREGSAYMSRSTSHLTLTLFHSAACHCRNTKIQKKTKYNKKNTEIQKYKREGSVYVSLNLAPRRFHLCFLPVQCTECTECSAVQWAQCNECSAVQWVQCSAEIEMLSVLAMPHAIWKWTHRLCTIHIPVFHLVKWKSQWRREKCLTVSNDRNVNLSNVKWRTVVECVCDDRNINLPKRRIRTAQG